jgi:hypothetical protein
MGGRAAASVRGLEAPVSRTFRVAGWALGASLFLHDRRTAARDLLEDAAELGPPTVDFGVLAITLLALLDLEERRPAAARMRISQASVFDVKG